MWHALPPGQGDKHDPGRLTLRKIRELLRLKEEAGLSNRATARACKISNSTVGEYLRCAQQADLRWPLPDGMGDDELYRKMFPKNAQPVEAERLLPDWETIRHELKKKGEMLKLLWIEYRYKHTAGYQYKCAKSNKRKATPL
jgi:hypothetical protein